MMNDMKQDKWIHRIEWKGEDYMKYMENRGKSLKISPIVKEWFSSVRGRWAVIVWAAAGVIGVAAASLTVPAPVPPFTYLTNYGLTLPTVVWGASIIFISLGILIHGIAVIRR